MESTLTEEELRLRRESCRLAIIKAVKGQSNENDYFYRKFIKWIIQFVAKKEPTVVLQIDSKYVDIFSSHKGESFTADELENIESLPEGYKIFFKPDGTPYFLYPHVFKEYLRKWKKIQD